MPKSSARFETVLTPDPRLRLAVVSSGLTAAAVGCAVIFAMPLPLALRMPFAVAWAFGSYRELQNLVRGAARLKALCLDAEGDIAGLGPDGRAEPLRLLAGSRVLKKLAWLRVRFADGLEHAELLAGDPATDPAWQRLQLIWRLRRGAFGGPDGS